MITALTVVVALAILGWGFNRARPYGKVGILAWLQSVALMAPWLLFFGLFAVGIYLNLAGMLFLFLVSTGAYIFIGRQLRAAGQDALSKRAAILANPNPEPRADDPAQPEPTHRPALETVAEALQPPDVVPIPAEDLQAIKGIFGIDTFFVTETTPYQEGAIFQGNLRGEIEPTFTQLSKHLEERVGDRYRLFLIENPQGKPVVIVLPSRNEPQPSTLTQKLLAIILLVATIATSLETGGILLGFDFYGSPDRFREVLPTSLGLLAILGIHELGHWLMARRYQVRLSLPYFIPTWQIGSFGAITRFESFLPNRSALFDIAIAGPAAGGILSLAMLITGLSLSNPESLFKVPTQFFEGSILIGTLARVILGTAVQQPIVAIHPLVVLGWIGLIITAINTMPAGQLDGGRIVQAIYGRKTANRTTIATILVLAIASLVNPLALYWAVVIVVLQRNLERPSFNELTEPDDARAALGLLALFLMITILLPLTPSLAGRLGIGG
ncbi:site-2 protease family protein [Myxacorys almedinensis]|uniref:Site-2 protease family protein n=1 Tax=Myxacorys almedinensis A TaxID=2690445 RepID=A0A8J8CIZ9_9CYAN|nr:site-2 protease family protein [Myxacorys almedinensis]NDJ17076.1 site-2 protease family protein [Myxacorys almedinensis A]